MKWWNKKKFDKLNRSLHRDLGYLFIGLTLIYGLSGIAVILRQVGVDLVHSEMKIKKKFTPNLSKEEFADFWATQEDLPKLARVRLISVTDYSIMLRGGEGVYNKVTGKVQISLFKTNKFFKFVNDIHYNVGRRYTILAILYAFMLLFFAISGAIIVKGKNGFRKRGVWLALVGIVIPVLIYFL